MKTSHHRPDERPELTPDRNIDSGVEHSFPASDAVSHTASQGARAVPPESMMHGPAGGRPDDSTTIDAHFQDREAAKAALESLVREGPVDRRLAELVAGDDRVTLRFSAPHADASRLQDLVQRYGGQA